GVRKKLLGKFLNEELADALDRHYVLLAAGDAKGADLADNDVEAAIAIVRRRRVAASKIGALALVPFIGCLIWHGIDHRVPLFIASFAAFAVAFLGIRALPNVRKLA